ncbi:cotranscriptional regulator FAM172A isoform X5 [Myotis myotis]|nr:cotranscriptional regulator FAM172A isoform X5 [Myotis myotis]
MKKDEPPLDFPDTLEGFEYAFNEKGQLRHIKTGEPFVFNYREDLHRWNQKRYEALGEIITKYVYELLEKDCNLKKISIPVDASESEPKSFIFMSEDALTNPQKLMVLIHGSGVVRAGQWARRLIINEDLDSGTQIPFIKRAMDEGYGVIVLNPNENYIEVEKPKIHVQSSSDSSDEPAEKRERKDKVSKETKKRRDFYEKYRNPQREKEMMQLYIRENGSPEEHAIYVWDHFIAQSAAENVFFVAHSYGGLAFVELMIQREADVKSKVTAVALTDSVHNVWHQEAGKTIREWMRENCCNWVSSSEPLDTSVESMLPDCPRVSAVLRPNEEECGQSRLVRNNWIEAITKSKGNRPDRRYSNVFFSLSLFFENSTLSAISTHFSLISKCYYINVVSLFLSSIIRHFFLNI